MRKDVTTSFHFLNRDQRWEVEKPYSLKFLPKEDFPKTSCTYNQGEVTVEDIRGREDEFSVEKNGFAVMKLPSFPMKYEDFKHQEKVEAEYLKIIAEQLKEFLGARRVQVFDCLTRKSHVAFPIATGGLYDHQQPANIMHLDTTVDETRTQVLMCNEADAEDLLKSKHQYVNIWRPLKGPVLHWPLAVCDKSTFDSSTGLESHDAVFQERTVGTYEVYKVPGQKFYYLSEQTTEEALIMLQSDSDTGPGVPHASFSNPLAGDSPGARESIEVRALVFY